MLNLLKAFSDPLWNMFWNSPQLYLETTHIMEGIVYRIKDTDNVRNEKRSLYLPLAGHGQQ